MNYLITGASGFIGKRLIRLLLAAGNTVNYSARKRAAEIDTQAAYHCWDVNSAPPLECMGRLDAIIHLAGEPVAQRWSPEVKRRIHDSRVLGTRYLVDGIAKLKYRPKILVSASAIGYYGATGNRAVTEQDGPAKNDFLAEVCLSWEHEAQRARDFGVRVVTPRISVVLGRDGGALPKMLTPFRLGLGGTLGSGSQWMSWIHLDDITSMLRWAAENDSVTGAINAASPNPVTNAEFTRTLASVLHRPALLRVPKMALRLAMGEVADHATASMRVLPAVAQELGFPFRYPDLRDALQNILANIDTRAHRPPHPTAA